MTTGVRKAFRSIYSRRRVSFGEGSFVIPAGTTHFHVTASVSTPLAGQVFTITVTALKFDNTVDATYAGTVHLTSSDGQAVLGADNTLTSGIGTFTCTLKTVGFQTITATDTVTGTINGAVVETVQSSVANHFSVLAASSTTAGSVIQVTVTALTANNAQSVLYVGTVQLTSSDGQAVLPSNAALVNGTGIFSVTLKTAGNQTVIATDVALPAITGTSANITVIAAPAVSMTVAAPPAVTLGSVFDFFVTVFDVYSNIAKGYAGTVHFTSSDGSAVLPGNGTLTNGRGLFTASLSTAGDQTLTATDTVNGSLTATSSAIAVSSTQVVDHFAVTSAGSVTAGSVLSVTVTAQDSSNATVAAYAGTVHFTSTDGQAVLPSNNTLVSGTRVFSVTLKTVVSQTITVRDTITSTIVGTDTVSVTPAAAASYLVDTPSTAITGTPSTITVTALDAYSNTATGYSGTVTFTSSDGSAVLPSDSVLVAGAKNFVVTFNTVGSQTVTATDTVTGTITGTSSAVAVSSSSNTATHFGMALGGASSAATHFGAVAA